VAINHLIGKSKQTMKANPISNALILLALATLLTSCFKEPEFKGVQNIVVKELSANGVTVDAEALFYNPNGVSITLEQIDVNLVINDSNVGNVNYALNQKIEGKSDFKLPITVSFPPKLLYDNLLQGLAGLLTQKEYVVEYRGFVRAKAVGISLKIPVKEKKKIKF